MHRRMPPGPSMAVMVRLRLSGRIGELGALSSVGAGAGAGAAVTRLMDDGSESSCSSSEGRWPVSRTGDGDSGSSCILGAVGGGWCGGWVGVVGGVAGESC